MANFLWVGSIIGAVFGLAHGAYLYRLHVATSPADAQTSGRAKGFYYGLWAFALWTLFGSYVLAFWIVGFFGRVIARFLPRQRAIQ